ncbi:hypothetical protein CLV58_12544 [Spirosoma oryzae]|uniref:2-oxoglutarate-Fe(II)-dependent oxygenase superfamily protein n=1 Tax=Spirosoma oryzae TaxID=1469603 RepID=A0A2T0S8Q2_9BACT|nr:hypothetical protein [Spirosoma oryzae]PRY29782.1 hypothetical protein CLV58_12544 [Spirosoma oryzae]
MVTLEQGIAEHRDRVKFVGSEAVSLGVFDLGIKEMMCYLYLPVKMIDSRLVDMEPRLEVLYPLLDAAIDDYTANYGEVYERYIYVTAKRLFVTPDNIGNRPGWHCDGWGTDDINYIWTDTHPTVYNRSSFFVRKNDVDALADLESQAMPSNDYTLPVNSLVRIDSLTPHRTPTINESGMRTFVKISISRHRYNLEGNSHNYLFDYDWTLHSRREVRNMENGDFIESN